MQWWLTSFDLIWQAMDHSRVVSWRINCRCVPLVRGVVEVCCHVTQAASKHPVSCQVMSIPWMPKLATCWQTPELLGFLTREIARSETLSLAIWFVPVLLCLCTQDIINQLMEQGTAYSQKDYVNAFKLMAQSSRPPLSKEKLQEHINRLDEVFSGDTV